MVDIATSEARRRVFPDNVSVDDFLWMQAIVVQQDLVTMGRSIPNPNEDECALRRLLFDGIFDWKDEDRPWNASTRSMRYSAALTDRLWSLFQQERSRVGRGSSRFCARLTSTSRLIGWSRSSTSP